jgi:nicotinamidase-related amidase
MDNAFPEPQAIVLIDLQRDLVEKDGVLHEWASSVVATAADACARARAAGLPIIWVTVERHPSYRDAALSARQSSAPRRLVGGTDGVGVADPLAQSENDFFVIKRRVNAFHGTHLQQLLSNLDVTTLAIGGVFTEMAVESTVRTAADLDLTCVVLADACGSPNATLHENSIAGSLPRFGVVTSVTHAFQRAALSASA